MSAALELVTVDLFWLDRALGGCAFALLFLPVRHDLPDLAGHRIGVGSVTWAYGRIRLLLHQLPCLRKSLCLGFLTRILPT